MTRFGRPHCRRWARHLPHRDTTGMPGLGATLDEWAAWYSTCDCPGCASVLRDLHETAESVPGV